MDTQIKRSGITRDLNEELTPGERLLLWRRRIGWNQIEAANYYGVSIFKLKLAEYDKSKDFPYKNLKITLKPHEKCLIYRKRSKKTQTEIGKELGIGREWVRLQELGKVPCEKLLRFWEK